MAAIKSEELKFVDVTFQRIRFVIGSRLLHMYPEAAVVYFSKKIQKIYIQPKCSLLMHIDGIPPNLNADLGQQVLSPFSEYPQSSHFFCENYKSSHPAVLSI
jgi:hypothetical protein